MEDDPDDEVTEDGENSCTLYRILRIRICWLLFSDTVSAFSTQRLSAQNKHQVLVCGSGRSGCSGCNIDREYVVDPVKGWDSVKGTKCSLVAQHREQLNNTRAEHIHVY